jgi:hypothetical protein
MLRAKGEEFAGAARGKANHLKERVPEQVAGRGKSDDQTVYPG